MSANVTSQPVGVYIPAASDVGNTYIQSQVTYIGAPAAFIGNIQVIPSTANTPSQVYVSTELVSNYPFSKYEQFGSRIAYYIQPAFSG